MNKSKWMTMAAVLTLSASMAVAAPHEGMGGGHHGRRGGQEFGARFAKKLNLSDAQKQQIKDIRTSFRAENKAFFEQVKATHQQLRDARKSQNTAAVDALKPTLQAQRAQMQQLRQAELQRVLTILTPEQRAQFEQMKAQRDARRAERGQRGGRNSGK